MINHKQVQLITDGNAPSLRRHCLLIDDSSWRHRYRIQLRLAVFFLWSRRIRVAFLSKTKELFWTITSAVCSPSVHPVSELYHLVISSHRISRNLAWDPHIPLSWCTLLFLSFSISHVINSIEIYELTNSRAEQMFV